MTLTDTMAEAHTGGAAGGAGGELALYVHWPFCRSKCPYCDFNSHVAETIDHAAWRAAYLRELETVAKRLPGRRLVSVFFGGGTPSLMEPRTVADLLADAYAYWPRANGGAAPEVTLEANPNSVEAGKFAEFRAAGVDRVSLGLQALDDAALAFLGRAHSAAEALAALDVAAATFARVNADMIYARPGQTVAAWERELAALLERAPAHLSLYQLTIERGTPFFAAHRRGEFTLPDEDAAAALYAATARRLEGAGLFAYEVSNYARPGEECRHNLVYWRYGDYAGIGPGAHGRLTTHAGSIATETHPNPRDWLAAVEATGTGLRRRRTLHARERLEEMTMMGLRLTEGIDEADLVRVTGQGFAEAFDPARLGRLVDGGFLVLDGHALRASAEGRLRLDAVLAELLA